MLRFTVRETPNMGFGVFAGRDFADGELLDEYFGELLPQSVAACRIDDAYIFDIGDVASASARDYGNWTRFVNHRCKAYNVEPIDDIVGGRQTITFRARGPIDAGKELLLNYGANYFGIPESYILCSCPDYKGPHSCPPPRQGTKRPANQEAFPTTSRQKRQRTEKSTKVPPDVSITEKNTWIAENKNWLGEKVPNGYPSWTMVHWRLLEQIIRRRRNYDDWREKPQFRGLTSSKGDPLIGQPVSSTFGKVQMPIQEWHLDVTKAFGRDEVCGSREGVPWGTEELLRRVFALVVADRRRRKRSGRKRSRSVTPPPIVVEEAAPVTPKTFATVPGAGLTPPETMRPRRLTSGGEALLEFMDTKRQLFPPRSRETVMVRARAAAAARRRRKEEVRRSQGGQSPGT
jgi:hypothetical protein